MLVCVVSFVERDRLSLYILKKGSVFSKRHKEIQFLPVLLTWFLLVRLHHIFHHEVDMQQNKHFYSIILRFQPVQILYPLCLDYDACLLFLDFKTMRNKTYL